MIVGMYNSTHMILGDAGHLRITDGHESGRYTITLTVSQHDR